ncbi:MAG: TIR domain-containing protein, partial [Candidatus Hydrogenedentales bacterium]
MSVGATYVIFDGDNDRYALAFMRGWKVNNRVEFDFRDAHDIGVMTARARDEAYVKSELRNRMQASDQALVLVGESTKNLRKYVGWEINLALKLDLPIIVVNLNGKRKMDSNLCPVPLRAGYIAHVAYKRAIIKYALEHFPSEFAGRDRTETAARHYDDDVYRHLGID